MRKLMIALGLLMLAAPPAFAHHPFTTEFDAKAPVQLSGKVTKVDWVFPHATIHLAAKDDRGVMRNWSLETASPELLKKMGWKGPGALKPGQQITVHGYRAKSKSEPFTVSARMIEVGGKTLTVADPADGGPGA
jgi:hypothetical protein